MITKMSIVGFFSKGKVIFATVADASEGRKDIYVLFNSEQDVEKVYAPLGKVLTPAYAHRVPNVMRVIQQFHIPKKKSHRTS